jgi:hypothetical protein
MRVRSLSTLLLALALALLPESAEAEATGKPCGALRANGWHASDLRATHLTCASARTKLRRWLNRGRLPDNPYGWNCFRWRGRRMCAVGQGDAPRFTFRLRRAARSRAAASIRECGGAGTLYNGQVRVYNVTSRVVSCRFARRFARRQILYGGPACREDRWCTYQGWRCRHIAYRAESDIRCSKSGGRVVRWQYG